MIRKVSVAKQTGNGAGLYPEGCSAQNVPNDLFNVIEYSLTILSWFELPEDERPPKWMWTLDHELEGWWEKVKQDRKTKYGGSSDNDSADTFDEETMDHNLYFDQAKDHMKKGGNIWDLPGFQRPAQQGSPEE